MAGGAEGKSCFDRRVMPEVVQQCVHVVGLDIPKRAGIVGDNVLRGVHLQEPPVLDEGDAVAERRFVHIRRGN